MTAEGRDVLPLPIADVDRRLAKDLQRRELLHVQEASYWGRRTAEWIDVTQMTGTLTAREVESIRTWATLAASHYHAARRLRLTYELVLRGGESAPYRVELDDVNGEVRLIDESIDSVVDDGDAVEVLRRVIRYIVNPLIVSFRSADIQEEPDR